MQCAVLGGGIIGVATAFELARDGHEVTLYERGGDVAVGASHANGGVIGASQVEPWAAPGMPAKILRWLGRADAPLLLRLNQAPAIWRWGLRFLARCTAPAYRQATLASLRLALLSLERMSAYAETLGPVFPSPGKPVLKIFSDNKPFEKAAAFYGSLRQEGFPAGILTAEQAARLEPALRDSAAISGAIHFPPDQSRDCRACAVALREAATSHGARFRFGAVIEAIGRSGDRIETIRVNGETISVETIVCALGSWTPAILRPLGLRVPVIPTKGLTITVPAQPWPQAPTGAIIDATRIFGLVRLGERLRVSGTAEIAGFDDRPDERRWRTLLEAVAGLFPDFRRCLAAGEPSVWAGLRPTSPDGPPIIGRTPLRNLYLATGHGPQGWTGAFGTAFVLAELIGGRPPPIDLGGLEFERFG